MILKRNSSMSFSNGIFMDNDQRVEAMRKVTLV